MYPMNSQNFFKRCNIFFLSSGIGVFFAMVLFTGGCAQQADVSAVDPLVKEYFEALKNGDLDKALSMYSDEFYKQVSRQAWKEKLQRLTKELGPIKAYSFRNKQADSRFSGEFYIYQYDTIHSAADGTEKRAKHTITFIQRVNSDKIKIAGHMIKAPGFD